MITEKSAGVIIFYLKDKPYFLLLEYPTYWGFVRGRIEKNESREETIKREAKEEANISKLNFLQGFKHEQKWFYKLKGSIIRKYAVYYLAEISEEQAKNVRVSFEHKAFRFLNLKESLEIMRIKNEKLMLEKAAESIKESAKQKRL